jgi:hypothetical protein
MTYLIKPATLPFKRDPRRDAIETWRIAEQLVIERWEQYTTAARLDRQAAFHTYRAALDAEEAAASELEQLNLRKAA